MQLLNYLYFLLITIIELRYLTSKGARFTVPFRKRETLWFSGPETFWVILFSTGILAFSAAGVIDLMAIRLLVLELLCLYALFGVKRAPVLSLPLRIYVLVLLWEVYGLTYTPSVAYGVRVILKYLYPFLLALAASAIVSDANVFLKSGLWARRVAVASVIFAFVPLIGKLVPGVFWYGTARAINYISIMVFSAALYFYVGDRKQKRWELLFTVLFLLPCFIWVFRTSIMGSGVALMVFAFFRYRLKSLPIIGGILVAGVIAVFFIPSLNQKMFKKDSDASLELFQEGRVSMDDVQTNTREAIWEHLENRFYNGHELAGSGTGAVQHYMYNTFIFGGLSVAHSDYVQMRCDNGLIGFWLYIAMMLSIVAHCYRTYWRYNSETIRLIAIVAGASTAGVMATLYSDNVVNYSMATLSMPFGFYGMMLGILRKYKKTKSV